MRSVWCDIQKSVDTRAALALFEDQECKNRCLVSLPISSSSILFRFPVLLTSSANQLASFEGVVSPKSGYFGNIVLSACSSSLKLLLGGAHTAMVMLRKQWVTFRIRYALHEGSNPAACCLDCGWLFNKLHNAKHPSKEKKLLELKQLFWGECSNTFLINLKKKTGLTFVKDVLKQALVPHYICSVEPVATVGEGEKFAPGERRGDRPVMATIEREATTAATAAGISSAEFILVDAEWKATCSYNGHTGKLTRGNREPRGAHDFVEPAADTAQQV